MNKQHVEFALDKWADKQDVIAPVYETKTSKIYGGRSDHYGLYQDDEGHDAIICIDLDFLREVPIEDETTYLQELFKMMPEYHDQVGEPAAYMAIHQASIAQRLEAIFKSQGGA